MAKSAEWFCEGIPAPQGSKKAFVIPTTNRAVVVESAGKKLKLWREVVKTESATVPKFVGAVSVSLGFYLLRPRADFRANSDVKITAPTDHVKQPDIDKLTRSVLDSLTDAGVIEDDSFVSELHVNKWWSDDDHTGVKIRIESL